VLGEQERRVQFLLRDRDAKFCRAFDDLFRSEGAEIVLTPVQAPNANAFAERWVCTVRAECLDWLLIVGRRHLEQVLRVYVEHYNAHRPHRALGLGAPAPPADPDAADKAWQGRIQRRDLLGGLLHALCCVKPEDAGEAQRSGGHRHPTAPRKDSNRSIVATIGRF
jgi:putative transposase